jgi:hypothetical protein
MLDLNIDYLQSTQMYVSYTLKNLIRKIDNLWPPKDKKNMYETFFNSKCQSKRCTDANFVNF